MRPSSASPPRGDKRVAGLLAFVFAGAKKQEYFAAVRAGLDKNYAPMERLFSEIIERSLAAS